MRLDIDDLLFDDGNEAKFARHNVKVAEVLEVYDHRPVFFENASNRSATHVMIGPTYAGTHAPDPDSSAGTRSLATGHRIRTISSTSSQVPEAAAMTDPDEDVQLGAEVEARRRPGSAIVAVRVSSPLLGRIQTFAESHRMTVSDVLRQGAEALVAETDRTTYSRTLTSDLHVRAAFSIPTSISQTSPLVTSSRE